MPKLKPPSKSCRPLSSASCWPGSKSTRRWWALHRLSSPCMTRRSGVMPKARRGEIWIADLGMVAKVRPVLILSVEYQGNERAVVTYVIRTTSVRGTQYEVPHEARGMPAGAFDAQGIASIPDVK